MRRLRLLLRVAIAASTAAALAACASTSVSISTDAAALRTGVSAARTHADSAFNAANELTRNNGIERKLDRSEGQNPQRNLGEDDFPHAVAPADAARWDRAFAEIDLYLGALQSLVDPSHSQATGDNLVEVANQLNSGRTQANLPAGLSAAFATLGQALVQARAERDATAIMRKTDSAFGALTNKMSAAIGVDNSGGLRGTVSVNWATVLAAHSADYARATQREGRRAIIMRYLAALDARDAQLGKLEELRGALLALGQAHSAASRGSSGDVMFWLARIEGWLGTIEQRRKALSGADPEEKSNGKK